MTALRQFILDHGPQVLTFGGLFVGLLFGAILFRTNFCTMGSISDIVSFGDYRRFRAWMLAAATAIIGTQAISYAGWVELDRSMYLTASLNWLGHIIGGLLFGYGMVFAGGCASRNLARAGSGDLRALITLVVLGIFAYMAMGGIIGPARAWMERTTALNLTDFEFASQGLHDMVAKWRDLEPVMAQGIAVAAVVLPVLIYCFASKAFRTSQIHVLSGIGVGLCVVAGWAVTGLAFDEMADRPFAPISLTYVRPAGDTLEWLQRYTALGAPGFGVATVIGALLGAWVTSLSMGRFRVVAFSDKGDTIRVLAGAAMMGIGGVFALGCTIGQGVTGVSTLAAGSFITLAAIIVGGFAGMRTMERMVMAGA